MTWEFWSLGRRINEPAGKLSGVSIGFPPAGLLLARARVGVGSRPVAVVAGELFAARAAQRI